MIFPGTDLKFKIEATSELVDLTEYDWFVEIINRAGHKFCCIPKDRCFEDADGNFYFVLENVPIGGYFAKFATGIPDEDYEKCERVITDRQHLINVGSHDCGCASSSECKCEHPVRYEQVWTVDLDDGSYLVGSDGEYILTSDGHRIKFLKDE